MTKTTPLDGNKSEREDIHATNLQISIPLKNCCGEKDYPGDYKDSPSANPDQIGFPEQEPIFDSS